MVDFLCCRGKRWKGAILSGLDGIQFYRQIQKKNFVWFFLFAPSPIRGFLTLYSA
jgi:hypothetical protein